LLARRAGRPAGGGCVLSTEPDLCRLLDSLELAAGVFTPEGRTLFVNRAPREASGISLAAVRGLLAWETPYYNHSPAAQDAIRRIFAEAAAGRRAVADVEIPDRDGGRRTLQATACPVFDDAGRVVQIVGIGADVTDRAVAQAALEQQRRLLEQAERVASLGSWEVDLASGEVFSSQGMLGILEWPADAPSPTFEDFYAHVPAAEVAELEARFAAALAGGESYDLVHAYQMGDGRLKWLHTRTEVEHAADGRALRAFGTVQDVTPLHEARAALEGNAAVLRKAQQVGGLGHWRLNLVNGVGVWSDEQYRLFGLVPGAMQPTIDNYVELVHPDDRAAVRAVLEGAIAAGRPATFSFEHRLAAGTDRRTLEHHFEVETDGAGTTTALFGVSRDITARKRMEEALRRANENLERRIAERTRDLVQAREQAEQASRAKSEFLAHVSHELRTPMNAVLGFTQLLLGNPAEPLSESQRENAEEVLQAGRHLMTLIGEMLDLARIESGRLTVEIGEVDVGTLVEECVNLIRAEADACAQTLELEPGVIAEPRVLADPQRLRQVLLNLLSNAIKYNRDGGGVTVSVARSAGRCRIAVADQGAGIHPADLARLFVPFERLGQDHKRTEGTGIGLALSKRLVEAMDGELGVSSAPGAGSCFWIELPLASASRDAAAG
ncbi:MAG: PAS domain-containing protein, partial [Gammaproteobacteria bacterium]|nr:PAS domain-containing protein [Gammaproteobacteria bacterium]